MERQVLWSPWTGPGLEHVRVSESQQGIVADGLIIGVSEQPFRVHYEIHCDEGWRLNAVHIDVLSSPSQSLHLFTDGAGLWTTESSEVMPALNECLDVDISATPFTNTLPIRRLMLQPDSSTILNMVYIKVPQMQVSVMQQRYTCLETTSVGSRYRFESLVHGKTRFTAELPVDQDGLVMDYPELFRRVAAW